MDKSSKIKGYLITLLKFGVVGGALAYLVGSGKLKLSNLHVGTDNAFEIALGIIFLLTVMLISFFRYWLLLKGLKIDMKLRDVMRIGFIGTFFNTFMLGSMGGDVIKLAYVMRESHSRAGAVASVMVDRILGLMGLLTIGGIALYFSWPEILATPSLHNLALGTFGVLGGAGLGVCVSIISLARGRKWGFVFWFILVAICAGAGYSFVSNGELALRGDYPSETLLRGRATAIAVANALLALLCVMIVPSCQPGRTFAKFLGEKIPLGDKLLSLIQSILVYRDNLRILGISFMLSMALQMVNLMAIFELSQALPQGKNIEATHIFFSAPPALVANAMPMPGGGLGVGELAFDTLLRKCRTKIDNTPVEGGADVFLLFRCWMLALGLIGLPIYLRGKKQIDEARHELDEMESGGNKSDPDDKHPVQPETLP